MKPHVYKELILHAADFKGEIWTLHNAKVFNEELKDKGNTRNVVRLEYDFASLDNGYTSITFSKRPTRNTYGATSHPIITSPNGA